MTVRLALYQPDIPQNTGAMLRLAACLDVPVDLIHPTGFLWSDRRLRRAGMDYLDLARLRRHESWEAYQRMPRGRLVLLSTHAAIALRDFTFQGDDTLMVGRESAGVPAEVHAASDARVVIPMAQGARALNVALAAAIALGEALRQTGGMARAPIRVAS
jgi:tRNA (cytidine/uridine-2'-O-)-methyltransferase